MPITKAVFFINLLKSRRIHPVLVCCTCFGQPSAVLFSLLGVGTCGTRITFSLSPGDRILFHGSISFCCAAIYYTTVTHTGSDKSTDTRLITPTAVGQF